MRDNFLKVIKSVTKLKRIKSSLIVGGACLYCGKCPFCEDNDIECFKVNSSLNRFHCDKCGIKGMGKIELMEMLLNAKAI